jgi:hypothetical protein
MILIGTRPMGVSEFIKQKKFKLSVFTRISLPLGQYYATKLINLGANRWAFKLGAATSYTFLDRFILEGHLNSWFLPKIKSILKGTPLNKNP